MMLDMICDIIGYVVIISSESVLWLQRSAGADGSWNNVNADVTQNPKSHKAIILPVYYCYYYY